LTGSIQRALAETRRRRAKQLEFNAAHGITPRTIRKAVADVMEGARAAGGKAGTRIDWATDGATTLGPEQAMKKIKKLEAQMYKHARNLEFEEAARVRDEIEQLRQQAFGAPGQLAG
jgi:excinuclease ABC subunit B